MRGKSHLKRLSQYVDRIKQSSRIREIRYLGDELSISVNLVGVGLTRSTVRFCACFLQCPVMGGQKCVPLPATAPTPNKNVIPGTRITT